MNRKLGLKIYFENEQDVIPLTYKMKMLIRQAVETTLDFEDFQNHCEVSVTFTDNEGIHELNKKFREVDKPTDVLSFPLFDFEGESEEPPIDEIVHNLGDIVISLERAREQAKEIGHSFEEEVAFLTVHSMLHLLGYDHEIEQEKKEIIFTYDSLTNVDRMKGVEYNDRFKHLTGQKIMSISSSDYSTFIRYGGKYSSIKSYRNGEYIEKIENYIDLDKFKYNEVRKNRTFLFAEY